MDFGISFFIIFMIDERCFSNLRPIKVACRLYTIAHIQHLEINLDCFRAVAKYRLKSFG